MKILWFPRLQPDVMKLHLTTWREMCKEFELMGCDVKIAITGEDEDNVLDRERIHIFLIKKKFLRILSFWISGYAKFVYHYLKFKPDVVLLDVYSIWFSLPFVFKRNRKAIFLIDNRAPHYCRGSETRSLRDKVIKHYTNLCYLFCKHLMDGMTVITDYYKEYVHKNYNFPKSNIGVWGSGVDMDSFNAHKYSEYQRPDFLQNKFVVMQHGEISVNRGLLETLEAIKLVGRDDICLFLLGGGWQKNIIMKKVEELGVQKNVYIMPPVDHSEIPSYISYSDCAIMAYPNIEYWNNNNPIKLLEYLSMGKLIICTDMWTFRSVGGDSKCIHYLKDNKPESIASAIEYLYKNRDRIEEWGKEGVDAVKEKFTWHCQAKSVLDFCKDLNKQKG